MDITCKSDTASDIFSAAVAFTFFGRYKPGSGKSMDAKNEIPVIERHRTMGIGEGRSEIVGAAAPHPTATVIHIIVTEPTLVGGTRSSIMRS